MVLVGPEYPGTPTATPVHHRLIQWILSHGHSDNFVFLLKTTSLRISLFVALWMAGEVGSPQRPKCANGCLLVGTAHCIILQIKSKIPVVCTRARHKKFCKIFNIIQYYIFHIIRLETQAGTLHVFTYLIRIFFFIKCHYKLTLVLATKSIIKKILT